MKLYEGRTNNQFLELIIKFYGEEDETENLLFLDEENVHLVNKDGERNIYLVKVGNEMNIVRCFMLRNTPQISIDANILIPSDIEDDLVAMKYSLDLAKGLLKSVL